MLFRPFAVVLLSVLLLVSCSISDRWVHEDAEGVVPESFFSTVKKNKTHKTWLVDNIGEPQVSVTGPNNEELVSYSFKRTRYRNASLLLVLRYDGSVEDVNYYHVLYCDDIVKKAWWDSLQHVDVSRVTRGSKCGDKKEPVNHAADMKKDMAMSGNMQSESSEMAASQNTHSENHHADESKTELSKPMMDSDMNHPTTMDKE